MFENYKSQHKIHALFFPIYMHSIIKIQGVEDSKSFSVVSLGNSSTMCHCTKNNRKVHNAVSLEEDGNSSVGEQKVSYRESFQASKPQLVLVKAHKVLAGCVRVDHASTAVLVQGTKPFSWCL